MHEFWLLCLDIERLLLYNTFSGSKIANRWGCVAEVTGQLFQVLCSRPLCRPRPDARQYTQWQRLQQGGFLPPSPKARNIFA
jgi:hypothetical protein